MMLPADGPVLAPAEASASALAATLGDRVPLVLAPGSPRGWFGGHSVVAWDPSFVRHASWAESADLLDTVRGSTRPVLAACLAPYDGPWTVAVYRTGAVRTPDGWRAWGTSTTTPLGPVTTARLEPDAPLAAGLVADLDRGAFTSAVDAVRDRIAAGDFYVLNLTYRLAGRPTATPAEALAAIVDRTRADMAAAWLIPGREIVSGSPERFLRVRGSLAEIHPIKGTRPRGRTPAEDAELAAGLIADEKERAEHVMIVDLERNDLGRVSEVGSVEVDPLYEVIGTPYCHQLASAVRSTLRDGVGLREVLDATFPCGSVTGAPKIAAMRHIAGLERSPRGAYTGSLLVAVPGELDSSVLIRTAEYRGGLVTWGTGCGVTIDSDPEAEWLESVLKARPFAGGH